MALIKVQGRGQVTIPAQFREALGIKAGYTLLLQQLSERKFIVNVIPQRTSADFPTVDIDIDMEQIREDMGRSISDEVYPVEAPQEALAARREAAATTAENDR